MDLAPVRHNLRPDVACSSRLVDEALAAADQERFILETRAYELEQMKEKVRLA